MKKKDSNEEIIQTFFKLHKVFRNGATFQSKFAHLSPAQIHTLFFLEEKKIPVSEIAKCFSIAIPTATELLDRLVAMRLVTRGHSKEDRRIVNVSLTDSGKALIKKAKKQRHEKINVILSKLSLEDKKQLLRILQKVTEV